MDVLITYDIDTTSPSGQRRLTRVAKTCERFGVRVQYSVFECRLSETSLARLIAELADIIDGDVDSVNFYRFRGSLSDARSSIGRRVAREPADPWLV